jgi:hypothetical protein
LPIRRVQGFVKKIDIKRLLSDLAFKFGNLHARLGQFAAAAFCRRFRRNLRGPGLGPRLRFNPAGPCRPHALRQSCRSLRETPSSRAKGNTASPASSRLIAASLKAVGNVLNVILSVIGHPQG